MMLKLGNTLGLMKTIRPKPFNFRSNQPGGCIIWISRKMQYL